MSVELAFSIGPVQGFVAQARRTRDFWGGSYLLSFLTAHAIVGALKAGAKIAPDELKENPLVRRVRGEREGEPPRFGSVPNHFEAATEDLEQARKIAQAAEAALEQAWELASESVWNRFLAPANAGTRAIWDRQIRNFWEIAWAAGENASELLARRKLWRAHWPPEEPGDKCSVMPQYQELSGFVRARNSKAQDEFWNQIRQRTRELDLRKGERLCAIALVKRLYAKCAKDAIGWRLDTTAWPSTVDFAELPWMRRVSSDPEACKSAREYADLLGQWAPPEAREGARHFKGIADCGGFAQWNGDYLHPVFLKNHRVTPLRDEARRKELQDGLKPITKLVGSPAVYYAVLLADGDRLGKLIQKGGDEAKRKIATVLNRFAKDLSKLSEECDAVRVYAGGDDVLALLPLEGALSYADSLALLYKDCFTKELLPEATLSAAVVFAHMTAPLSRVLSEVRRLLDDVAKEQNGRNSLAIGVYRRSGPALEWVSAWDRDGGRAVALLQQLTEALKSETERDISSGVVHRVHDLLWRLFGNKPWRPGACLEQSVDVDIEKLVRAEIVQSLEKQNGGGKDTRQRAKDAAAVVCNLLPSAPKNSARLRTDALLLARFLAKGGQEEEHL